MADPISIGLLVGSTVLSAAGAMQEGWAAEASAKAQQQQLEYQAKTGEIAAGQERASAQRRAMEERRQAGLASSRAQALAAAGGGGTLDPSIINIMGDLAAEGEYAADVELYEGEERARELETGAELRKYEGRAARAAGKRAKKAGYMKAAATVMKGGSSMAGKLSPGTESISWSDGTSGTYGRTGRYM